MRESQTPPTIKQAAEHKVTMIAGVVMLGVWMLFLGFALYAMLFNGREFELPVWVHFPGVVGAAMASPGILKRISDAWR